MWKGLIVDRLLVLSRYESKEMMCRIPLASTLGFAKTKHFPNLYETGLLV